MLFKRLKRLFFTPASAGILLLCLTACQQEEKGERVLLEREVLVVEDEGELFIGRLYSSGLAGREMEALGLEEPVFQLVGTQSYFISGSDTLRDYIGTCLGVRGAVKEEWEDESENVPEQITYNRLAIEVGEIEIMEEGFCTGAYLPEEEMPAEDDVSLFRGRLRRMQRPAPDVAYDYQLVLADPIRLESDPILPGRLVKDLPLVLFEVSQVRAAERAIAGEEEVEVEGALGLGYVDQRVLEVRQLEIVE